MRLLVIPSQGIPILSSVLSSDLRNSDRILFGSVKIGKASVPHHLQTTPSAKAARI